MGIRPHPAGYHCAKALRGLGLDADAIVESLRRRLALDTGEIDVVLSYPITPPEGVPLTEPRDRVVDLTHADQPRRRRGDVDSTQ